MLRRNGMLGSSADASSKARQPSDSASSVEGGLTVVVST
jgi:hypothetical protein